VSVAQAGGSNEAMTSIVPTMLRLNSSRSSAGTQCSQSAGGIIGGIVVLALGEHSIPVLWRAAMEPVPDPLA
jgi:hypothetical protein